MNRRAAIRMTDREVEDFLARSPTGVLTTLDRKGWPHSVAMWFVPVFEAGRRQVLMWSYAKSQKCVNVRRDPRCAFLVEEGAEYLELRGLLVQTRVRIISDVEEVAGIGRALHERYVSARTGVPLDEVALAEIERQAAKRMGLALDLGEVASWDHAKLGRGY